MSKYFARFLLIAKIIFFTVTKSPAYALDEAIRLIADTKLIDRVYAGDLVTVKKIIFAIRRQRAKYLDMY
jgi:hypothetical protein